jgi:hypothetical protein
LATNVRVVAGEVGAAVHRLVELERVQHGRVRRVVALARRGQKEARVVGVGADALQEAEVEAGDVAFDAEAVLVGARADAGLHRVLVAAADGEGRAERAGDVRVVEGRQPVAAVAVERVAEAEVDAAVVRQEPQVEVAELVPRVARVLARREVEQAVAVGVAPEVGVEAIPLVLLDVDAQGAVGVCAEAGRVDQEGVEEAARALACAHEEARIEDAEAGAVVEIGAVLVIVAVHAERAHAQLDAGHDAVAARGVFVGRGGGLPVHGRPDGDGGGRRLGAGGGGRRLRAGRRRHE